MALRRPSISFTRSELEGWATVRLLRLLIVSSNVFTATRPKHSPHSKHANIQHKSLSLANVKSASAAFAGMMGTERKTVISGDDYPTLFVLRRWNWESIFPTSI